MQKKIGHYIVKNKKYILGFLMEILIVLICLAVDLLTKEYIYGGIIKSGKDIVIIPKVLRLTAVENTGASFGIFKNSTKFLSYVSLVSVIIVFAFMIFSIKDKSKLLKTSLSLILAGGLGNLIDRFKYEYVRDFIYFELINFPVFNLADSALTIGCILAIIWVIFVYAKNEKAKDKEVSDKIDEPEVEDTDSNTDL